MNEFEDNGLPRAVGAPVAHPLAVELAERVAEKPVTVRVLVLGVGSGRNVPPFRKAACEVTIVEDDQARARAAAKRFSGDANVTVICAPYAGLAAIAYDFRAALSTHALLHGHRAAIGAAVRAVREHLRSDGLLFATLGSTRDPRYGRGHRIDAGTYAARSGPEAGIAHAFFDEAGARKLFAGFVIESLTETSAAETAGRWAHTADEAASLVHWFVRARKTEN